MNAPPRIFISATSGELRSVRQIVKEALLTINCHPVEQTNFEPDYGPWRACCAGRSTAARLSSTSPGCATAPSQIIHAAAGHPRRSYTQMEYHLGCQLHEERGDDGFHVYTFVCPESFLMRHQG